MNATLPERSKAHAEILYLMRDKILENHQDQIAFIILFGSFARGNWVYDYYREKLPDGSSGAYLEYASDYDVLIVTRKMRKGMGRLANQLKWAIEATLEPLFPIHRPHRPHVIIEPIQLLNKALEEGQYFYSDIKKEGVCLYDSGECELKEAKELTAFERKAIAEQHFAHWFKKALTFFKVTKFCLKENELNNAAFELHQATESLLNGTLLVLTGYKPKLHDIEELLSLSASQRNEFLNVFPKGDAERETCFELLKRAYIDARYNMGYVITEAQLQYLISEVEKLKTITEKVCQSWITQLSESV